MVKIKYYADPMKPATEVVECLTVADFLLSRFNTRDQLLDLRFFDEEILGHEIDQSGGDFLDIDAGTVAITHDSMLPRDPITWVYVVVAVVFAATVIILRPKIPDLNGSNDQQSGTNRLGDSRNEPRINQRIDDIFGTVTRHTPPLWQVPYRIGINNQEAEVLLVCIGRGKYQIPTDTWRDGDTPVINIPNASVNIYGPGSHPGKGSPLTVIGEVIDEPIGVYRQSNDLNPSELAPPNELENAGVVWRLSGSGGNAVLTAITIPDGFNILDFYQVGDIVTLNQMNYFASSGTTTLYIDGSFTSSTDTTGLIKSINPLPVVSSNPAQSISVTIPIGAISVTDGVNTYTNDEAINIASDNAITTQVAAEALTVEADNTTFLSGKEFQTYSAPVDLGQNSTLQYVVLSRTASSITLSIPVGTPAPVVAAWAAMSNYIPPTFAANVVATGLNRYILDPSISLYQWQRKSGTIIYNVTKTEYRYKTSAGAFFDNIVGPVFTPLGATEILLNFVSPSGFYKLKDNNEVKITANIKLTVIELDSNGDETGLTHVENIEYSSNDVSVRQSVFKSVRIPLPYTRSKVTAERTTNRDKSDGVSNVDIIEWRDFFSFEPVGEIAWQEITGGTFVFDDIFAVDNIPLTELTALGLSPGTDNAGETVTVEVPSQSVNAILTITSILSFGPNYSIYFDSVPAGAITASGVFIRLSTGQSTLDLGDVTVAQVIIPSNSQSRLVKERKQNCDVTRLVTQYLGNGNFGPAESYATDQFDQILIHAMLDPAIGRMSLGNINADGFLDLRDEIETYFGSDEMCRFGYDFDTTSLTAQDTFFTICDAVMCVPYHQAGVYDAFFEKKQDVSTMQVTCRNKKPGTESRKKIYDKKNDGVEITYRSNETGASEVIYIPQDQSSLNPERIPLKGCTSKLQAFRYGSRIYNKQKHQIEFVKFDVDEFGRNIIPGKRLDSPDSTRFTKRTGVTDGYRVYDGEVVEVNGLEVELSEPVEFTEGEDHYIVFTKENGDNTESILCTRVNDFTVLLGVMPSEPIYDGYSRDRTKFTFTSEQLRQSVALLPRTIEFNIADDGSEVNTINGTNYSHKFYDGDLEFPL